MAPKFPARLAVFLHASVFAVATGTGWSLAEGDLPPRDVDAVWQEALPIVQNNLRAVCVLVVAAVATGGVAGLMLFAVNGFAFGTMLGMAPVSEVHWVLLYAPVEVAAFTLAGVEATRLSWIASRWLCGDKATLAAGPRLGAAAAVVAGALGAAALLEAWAIHGAWGDD